MKPRALSTGGIGLAVVALGCLAFGGLRAYLTHRFVARAGRVTGTIFYSTADESNTLLVTVPNEDGLTTRIYPVRAAWWTPPWQYLTGETVTILYDPKGDYDAPILADRARIDSWAQLWLGSAFWIAVGILCTVGVALARKSGATVRVSVNVETGS